MIIKGASVTEAWLEAVNEIVKVAGDSISPVEMKICPNGSPHPLQDNVENELNAFLESKGKPGICSTANTIFPINLVGNSNDLAVFERYERIWKYVRKEPKNKRGTYFRRLSAYGDQNSSGLKNVNQLEHIIDTYNGIEGTRKPVHRRSALIATVFDPYVDHISSPMLGFPCLQQVCFVPKGDRLSMNAVYAMQYLDVRGYGNYLGLIRLGEFMAHHMGLRFSSLTCMISTLSLSCTKAEAKNILKKSGYPL